MRFKLSGDIMSAKYDWKNVEALKEVVANSITQTEVLKKLGLSLRSGNHQTLLNYIVLYNIDISHFEGKQVAYKKLREYKEKIYLSNENYFVTGVVRKNQSSKNRILKNNLKEHKCAQCGIGDIWNNKPLVLQLDHINGDRLDNRLENLQFLCPNCHSQTETFGNNKRTNEIQKIFDITKFQKNRVAPDKETIIKKLNEVGIKKSLVNLKISYKNFVIICAHYKINLDEYRYQNKIVWPNKINMQQMLLEKTLIKLSSILVVSDNAIKKHALKHGLFLPTTIHKSYWLKVKNNSYKKIEMQDLVLQEGQYLLKAAIKGETNGKRSKTESETSRKN